MPRTLTRKKRTDSVPHSEIVRFSHRWTMTLPRSLRQGLNVDQVFEALRREDGVIELRPRALIDPTQTWFWSPKWQQMEREADEDIAAGRVRRFDSMEELFADLDAPGQE
jgi:hypothetical protein